MLILPRMLLIGLMATILVFPVAAHATPSPSPAIHASPAP